MSSDFRPAVRENVGLIIGLAGGTGSGKTVSAFLLAKGIAGDKPFAVIDTENRRALHYAGDVKFGDRTVNFRFDHGDLRAPFSPQAYADKIKAADDAGYPVIVVDSMSHEHAGEGGLLDMHEAELQRMAGNDWQKRENCRMAAWIKPKGFHKGMVNRLLQVRAHLILCLRAEEKVEMRKIDGRMQVVPKQSRTGKDGWIPVCEKNLPYELTASFLLLSDRPGFPHPIKLEQQHRHLFPLDKPINEESGRTLAGWAAGGQSEKPQPPPPAATAQPNPKTLPDRQPGTLFKEAEVAAAAGYEELRGWWGTLSEGDKKLLNNDKTRLQDMARKADEEARKSA